MQQYFLCAAFCLFFSLLSAQSDTIYGDLTKDGLPEMLVTVHHPEPRHNEEEDFDTLETATVFRFIDDAWTQWPAAEGFLMHAYDEAGMASFYATIERGALVLIHGKTGHLNWDTTHRFRWQNGRFELIGYTHSFLDRCEGSERFDYNLSNGNWIYATVEWECGEDWTPAEAGHSHKRRGVLPPEQAYTLREGGYLDFSAPE